MEYKSTDKETLDVFLNDLISTGISNEQEEYIRMIIRELLAYKSEIAEVHQILGKALGYPPYPISDGYNYAYIPARKTTQPNSDWVVTGDHNACSLSDEIVNYCKKLEKNQKIV